MSAAAGAKDRLIAVTALGLAGDALGAVADTAAREAARMRVKLLFIVDGFDFAPLRVRDAWFEQVIDAPRRRWSHPGYDWAGYRERQFELIGRKWGPFTVIAFGVAPPPGCVSALKRGAGQPVLRKG